MTDNNDKHSDTELRHMDGDEIITEADIDESLAKLDGVVVDDDGTVRFTIETFDNAGVATGPQ